MNLIEICASYRLWLVGICATCFVTSDSLAQSLGNDLHGFEIQRRDVDDVKIVAEVEPGDDATNLNLLLRATIKKGRCVSSTSQKSGGPFQTRIKVESSSDAIQFGRISYSPRPTLRRYPEIWPEIDVEYHCNSVNWTVPMRLKSDECDATISVTGTVTLLIDYPDRCGLRVIPFEAVVVRSQSAIRGDRIGNTVQ